MSRSRSTVFAMTPFDGKYQKRTNVCRTFFTLALTISEIYIILIFYLQKLGHGHRMQFSQLHHSMANVKVYKCLPRIFAQALTVLEI